MSRTETLIEIFKTRPEEIRTPMSAMVLPVRALRSKFRAGSDAISGALRALESEGILSIDRISGRFRFADARADGYGPPASLNSGTKKVV